ETEQTRLLSEQEALNLALASNRSEIDAQSEAARLAASKREALEALIADLQLQSAQAGDRVIALEQQLVTTADALSDEEAAKLVEAAAAEALRNRLENADAELTAMTLSLEAKRREAEETLTLLAAARAAEGDLNAQLVALLSQVEAGTSQSQTLQAELRAAQSDADNLRTQLGLTDQSAAELKVQLAAAGQKIADLQAQVASRDETSEEVQARLTAALAAKLVAEQSLNTAAINEDEVRKQLAAALAAKLQSEQTSRDLLSATEQQALLLENAKTTLSQERVTSAAAQRQTELLNQQV
ncbi:MAG TPA: peptidoglycan-binding protein, partial [Sulfitobacter sp.]|nr:peptidoglycan-binding protein [Sulfitobacter sp.]